MASVPGISVVIPARNAAATLKRALESVFAQSAKPREVIVVDDASSDATAVIALSCPEVRMLHFVEPRGAAAARNAGVSAAAGEWIAFLDADDVWLPEKLSRQAAGIADGVSLIFCASEEFDSNGRSLGDTFRGRPFAEGVVAWKKLLARNFIATPTVMAPRELLARLKFDETMAVGEDQDMWIRLALEGSLTYVPETLAAIFVQPQSLSHYRGADLGRTVLPMIRRHVERLRHRLAGHEIRAIYAARYADAGHTALAHGDIGRAAVFFARALAAGYRPSFFAMPAALRRQLG